MKKLNHEIAARNQARGEDKVGSRLACFVKAVKTNLCSRMKKEGLTPSTIREAQELEEKFKNWGDYRLNPQCPEDSEKHLLMDYIMHHRISLATEIVKSTANGRGLSQKREKVLRNSIDYIEQRL